MIDINVEQVARQWLEGLTPEIKKLGDSYTVLNNQLIEQDADPADQLNADSADEHVEWEEMEDSGNYEFPC
jgi:hypothetical protein